MARCCGTWMLEVERMRPAVPVDGLLAWPRCDIEVDELSSEAFSSLLPSFRRRSDSAEDLLRLC
jgi:hypothetical protein